MREVFDLFDFWDGRDGLVDAAKVGELLRCIDLNPTNAMVERHGGTKKLGGSGRDPMEGRATSPTHLSTQKV